MSPLHTPSQPNSARAAPPALRLFVAVELSDAARGAVSGVIERLVESGVKNLRPVRPEAVHLTLKFLGNVPSSRVEKLVEALRAVARTHTPFALALTGAGVFPTPKKARVLWLGIGGDTRALGGLYSGIEDAVSGLGLARDRKPFSPHLTVARLDHRASGADRSFAAETLASAPHPDGVEIPVRSVSIMQSTLDSRGAIHDRLASLPLGI
jgi:2'-5' RNA ligase